MDFTKISFALFDVYEFPNGLYTNKDICNKLSIGNPYDRKNINGTECYAISEKDIITVGTTTFYKAKIIPVLDMNISAKFTVYVDENDNNKLYVEKNLCHRHKIINQIERKINNKLYYQVSMEEIDKIERISKEKKLTLIRKYETIKLEKEKFNFNFFRTNNALYITRDIYELAKKHNVEIEGKPRIICNCNCYSIKEEELLNLEEKTNSIGKRVIIREPKTLETIVVYKDMNNNKIYIPREYAPIQSSTTKQIMNKICFESSEKELERIFNKKFIIANVYLNEKYNKPKEILNIILCKFENALFVPEELIKKLNIEISLQKKIKVNGNIFHQITEEELLNIKKESSKNYLVNITKKHIVRNQ